MKVLLSTAVIFTALTWFAVAQKRGQNETVTVSGLITPRDNEGMYVQNLEGQFDISWTEETRVALEVNTRLLTGLETDVLHYRIQASKEVIDYAVPPGPTTGVIVKRSGPHLEKTLQEATDESWIDERGLHVYFGEEPTTEQLPNEDDPRFIGLWDGLSKPRTLSVFGEKYEVSLKKGGQTNALLFNVIGTDDCEPFINRATVVGRKKGAVIIADEIHVLPIGDQTASDNPSLPRYLFIGDSISSNYSAGLRSALEGKFNLHHPPANCGPTAKGRANIVEWLGGYQEEGRDWDVISFNFGHWDAGNDKATYQENLEAVIGALKKTDATLIWVTTCPVPRGYAIAASLDENENAPGRLSGVMENFLNPWALEVIQRHPEISICDQWQFVKDHESDIYKQWWPAANVHFNSEQGAALGEFLADHVLEVMDMLPANPK